MIAIFLATGDKQNIHKRHTDFTACMFGSVFTWCGKFITFLRTIIKQDFSIRHTSSV